MGGENGLGWGERGRGGGEWRRSGDTLRVAFYAVFEVVGVDWWLECLRYCGNKTHAVRSNGCETFGYFGRFVFWWSGGKEFRSWHRRGIDYEEEATTFFNI